MVFESFDVSPTPEAVMNVEGKLICSYPGPAVERPLSIAQNSSFIEQLVSFVVHMMDADRVGCRGMGKEAQVHSITERIADDICWNSARNPWRRSSLWLVLCAAIQTTCPIIKI